MHRYLFALLVLFPLSIQASLDTENLPIQNRIKPIGNVHIEQQTQQTDAPPPVENKPTSSAAMAPGQKVYEQHCIVCHRDGVAGAPKFRDEAMWKPRLTVGIDALTTSAIKGKNAMPAKGTCQECSNSDIKAAIEYMVPQK